MTSQSDVSGAGAPTANLAGLSATSSGDARVPAADPALMAEWRWYYRRAAWSAGRPRSVAAGLAHRLLAPIEAGAALRRPGAAVATRHGISRVRQFAQLCWLRTLYGIEADWYYDLRLYEPTRWPRAHGVVRDREVTYVARYLNAADPARGRELFGDKLRIAAWCREHGLPTITTIVVVKKGNVVTGTAEDLPDTDLFSKLRRSYGGKGARRWWRRGEGRWATPEDVVGETVDREGVLAAACRQSLETGQSVLVQPALINHPAVAGITTGALATIRLVTMRTIDGVVQPVLANYRIPTGTAMVDSYSMGGLAAPIDVATGRLGRAANLAMSGAAESIDRHPDTGAPIMAVVLPDWPAAVALATRAHAAAPGMVPVIGWDIALTPEGPLLVEGNIPPGAGMQVVAELPMGETPLVACMIAYLRATDARR